MRKIKICLSIVILIVFAQCFLSSPSVNAGSSSLTKWDSGAFDLVISLGWTPTASEKTNLETVLNLFASDVYRMTEGKHYLKTLYVYTPNPTNNKARMWSKADVQFENSGAGADNANANVNGFTTVGGRIFVDDDLSDLNEVGHALAHELGHYAYGLYDEYAADQGKESDPSFPHKNDNAKNTLMSHHWLYQQFSTATDYGNVTERNTAQWRMYESSAWATLVRNASGDKSNPRLISAPKRYTFPDLNALSEPTSLTQPTSNPPVNIIWMEGSEAVIIIDHSGSMSIGTKMADAKSGAKSYLDKLQETDYGAVVIFDDTVSTIGTLAQLDAATKTAYKASIDGVSPDGMTAIGAALRVGLDILNSSTRQGTFKYIVLLTDGLSNTGESPTGSILTDLKNGGYPVYSIGLGSDADMGTLNTVSKTTNGKAFFAASSATLNAIYSEIQSMTSDDKLVGWVKDNLNLSKPSTTTTIVVDSSSKKVLFSAAFPSADTMELSLIMPNGTVINPTNVDGFSNITYIAEAGYALYEVTNPDPGEWQMTLQAFSFGGVSPSEVILEAKTDTDYSLDLEATGGTYPEPMLIAATLKRNLNIRGLTVEAAVTNPTGAKSVLILEDDSISPDAVAGDGIYTGIITNYTNGEYAFTVRASNTFGAAVETPTGVWKQGSIPSEIPISENFTLSANTIITASGVVADDHGSSFAEATELLTDGTLVAGRIEVDNDIDYFYFDVTGGEKYTTFTSGLYPSGMQTLVKLYDTNQATVLAQDKTSNEGISSKLIWTPSTSDRYYLTIEHGSPGTGIYSAGVRPTQIYDEETSTDGDGGICFIATAAYGTPMAEEIIILREFRDEYLLTSPMGQALVDFYYRVSPPIAEFIAEHPSLKPIVRAGLLPAVAMSTVVVNTTPAGKMVIVGLTVLFSVALAVWAMRRRDKGPKYT